MRKKYPLRYDAVPFALMCACLVPFVLVGMMGFGLARLSVKAVEACQRRFCEEALMEEREEDVELAGRPTVDAVNEAGEGSSGGAAEESVALMADTKSAGG